MGRQIDTIKRIGAAALAAAALGLIALTATGAAAPAHAWQVIPHGGPDMGDVISAAGRVWFYNDLRRPSHGDLRSAPVTDARLGVWKAVDSGAPEGWVFQGVLGDELVFADSADPQAQLYSVRLLPDGRTGPPTQLGGAAPPNPSSSSDGSPSNVVQLSDRAVRLVDIDTQRDEFTPDVGACCSDEGRVVDYASVTGSNAFGRLGIDRLGGLWLAWESYTTLRQPSHQARIVELDPQTLEPTGAVSTAPGFAWSSIRAMACGSTCRLIVEGQRTGASRPGVFTWAAGNEATTALRLPANAHALAARDDADNLVVAYSTGHEEWKPASVAVARRDARGEDLRVVSSVRVPQSLAGGRTKLRLETSLNGALGPDGFTTEALYSGGNPERYVARVIVLPVR